MSDLAGELNERTEPGNSFNRDGAAGAGSLSLCFRKRPRMLLFVTCPGDVGPSFIAVLVVCPLHPLIPLGVGLTGLLERLLFDELPNALPNAVPMEVGARSFCLGLAPESSRLMDGRSDLASSLLLLCRWLCPGRCTCECPDREDEEVLGGF